MSNSKAHNAIRALVEGSLLIAVAEILGYLKVGGLPNGGSISLMMLPIVLYGLRWGLGRGLLAGLTLGILDFMLAGGIALGWQSILGDYMIACTLIGLAGIGHKKGLPGVIFGAILGCLGRFSAVLVTGATIWKEYMPAIFLGLPMSNHWVYSLLYNGITVGLSALITVLICVALYNMHPLRKYFLGNDIY